MAKKYVSTKTYRQIAPCAYRQWRASSHCNQVHGYAFSFHFEFETDDRDHLHVDGGPKSAVILWFLHKIVLLPGLLYS